MAPKIPSVISCPSVELLDYEISTIRSGLELQETEDTWDKILNSLLRLNAVTVGSAEEYPSQIIAVCKGFVRAILNCLNSERSRLSGCATDLLSNLATHLGRPFETLIPLFVPTLLSLASRSIKIFVARAKACLMTIIENCSSPVILPLLRHAISDKSVTLRLTAVDAVVACLNCFNPPDLEAPKRVEDIEAVIRATARDTSADIRKSSRKAFEAYKILFPARVDAFVAPLTPTMKKYLDIRSAPANQRKPLLSSSASAPSIPSSSQTSDIMTRSHASAQGHAKSSSASSTSTATSFTRVERTTKSAKPPSGAQTSESASMPPPPPPQQKSSSGPIRPPPSMRQAIAAVSAAPTRPFFNRQASRIKLQASAPTVPDISKSQPVTHGGSEHHEKAPSQSTTISLIDAAKPIAKPAEAEPVPKARSTSGPRRVPKPEPVPVLTSATPVPSAAPAPNHKQMENLKGSTKDKEREKEKATFTSSASSTASSHVREPVFSRPPSRPASSTSNKAGEGEIEKVEEKEKVRDRERERRKRTESRVEGEFRPRPASRAEERPRKKLDGEERVRPVSRMEGEVPLRPASRMTERPASRMEGEVQTRPASRIERPASRIEGEILPHPESRMDRKAHARPSSRAEMKAMKAKKTTVEQADVQPQQQQQTQVEATADPAAQARREERRRRREERAQAEARAAAKRVKEERAAREKPSKKRREAVRDEMKPLNDMDARVPEGARQNKTAATQLEASENVKQGPAVAGEVEDQIYQKNQQGCIPESSMPAKRRPPRAPAQSSLTSSQGDNAADNSDALKAAEADSVTTEDAFPIEERAPQARGDHLEVQEQPRTVKFDARRGEYGDIRPLAIHKASDACVGASDVPLPPSPRGHSYEPTPFETPAPLRKAIASRKNQVPATPISKLMASIQHGFDPDFSTIGEEAEADLALSCVPTDAHPGTSAHSRGGDSNNNSAEDTKAAEEFFVDTRPRKLKSSHRKERHGHNEGRAPLKAQNR